VLPDARNRLRAGHYLAMRTLAALLRWLRVAGRRAAPRGAPRPALAGVALAAATLFATKPSCCASMRGLTIFDICTIDNR